MKTLNGWNDKAEINNNKGASVIIKIGKAKPINGIIEKVEGRMLKIKQRVKSYYVNLDINTIIEVV